MKSKLLAKGLLAVLAIASLVFLVDVAAQRASQ